jgi:hypothetical protein
MKVIFAQSLIKYIFLFYKSNGFDLIIFVFRFVESNIINMSSRRSYSKEARSYYSRSSSFGDNHSSSSYRSRPLSALLVERDFSSPSLALDSFDDPSFFERRSRELRDDIDRRFRSRFSDDFFDDEFFKQNRGNNSLDFGRQPPINYREYNSSSSTTRNVPVQYTPSSSNRRENVYKNIDDNTNWSSNSFQRNDQSFNSMFYLSSK